ncbi:MAG TPA: alpha/beta fold hydrolase [Candidatus Kryptobacter bacterium]|nr:alpha/beta fold hydrolase [Candidatus Kryptobacter bacterium]
MFLETSSGKIAFETRGEKKNKGIVFIHGFPFDRSMWNEQAKLLSKDHFVVSFDIRGHGESDPESGQYLIEFFVDDLIDLLNHLNLPSVCLCGLSMGGYTALRAIEREPSRFSGLVLCDTKSTADTNAAKLNRANQIKMILAGKKAAFADGQVKALFAPESFKRNGQAVERIRKTIESTKDGVLVGALIALAARMDMTESLSKISVPTLIMVGEDDKVTPTSEAELMHSKIRGSKVAVIRGAGHISNLENSQEFNSALQDFLAKNGL